MDGGDSHLQDGFLKCIKEYEKLVFHICFSFTKTTLTQRTSRRKRFLQHTINSTCSTAITSKHGSARLPRTNARTISKAPQGGASPPSSDLDLYASEYAGPEEAAVRTVGEDEVRAICEQLDDPYRTVAVKYFCEDVPLSELSRDTGQKLKTLQTRLYRAKKMMKELSEEDGRCVRKRSLKNI